MRRRGAVLLAPRPQRKECFVIEIREVEGRFEVLSPGRHWEVFNGKLGAQSATLALAGEIRDETGALPRIVSPWPVYPTKWAAGQG